MSDRPVFAVPDANLVPVASYPAQQMMIPPSRMFMIKKGLAAFRFNFLRLSSYCAAVINAIDASSCLLEFTANFIAPLDPVVKC